MLTAPAISPTQKDIADALGFAKSTVAWALNPKLADKLPAATVAAIAAKAKEMNYRPQRQARILRTRRSHTIGLVGALGPYHAPQERFRHLTRRAIQAGYQTVFIDINWFEGRTVEAQNYLLDMAVEGIIFCNIPHAPQQLDWQKFIRARSLPVVSINNMFEMVDQVHFDLCSAYQDMTRHHLEQGARRLALLLPFHDALPEKARLGASVRDRIEGFTRAIRAAGGEVIAESDISQIFDLPSELSSQNPEIVGQIHYPIRTELYQNAFDVGYHEASRVLEAGGADSFVCSNDDIATGAMRACSKRNFRVPEDVRISGADNTLFARYNPVPLTTIAQPPEQMVEWSIRRIVELIENPQKRNAPQEEIFPCELIFRESTVGSRIAEKTNSGVLTRPKKKE